jgi:two-component system OmpR family response regulator
MTRRVLIVEDDQDISHLVSLHLKDIDCDVEEVADGRRGLERARSAEHDLIILDLMLPGIDGLEICRRVRAQTEYTPILMLTARSSEIDRVLGLELGADDYLTKPFSILELVARVKALFRRIDALKTTESSDELAPIHLPDLTIEPNKRAVTIRGEPVTLTAKEFDLLLHFARQPGRVFTRTQLLDSVWGYGHDGYEHTVNSHINRLRSKIEEDHAAPRYILTVWGVGYRFAEIGPREPA